MKSTRCSGFKRLMQRGFTLVELAIVLVIAGIILVGVLKGTDSINKAKVERMVADLKGLQGSILEFQKRNNRLPGDCNNNGVIQLAVSAVGVAGVNGTLDKVERDPSKLAICGVPTSTTVAYTDDLYSGPLAASGVTPTAGSINGEAGTAFNLPFNEMRRAGIMDGNRTNEELGRHMFNDIYAISSMQGTANGSTLNANVIVVYGIPVWMAEAIDAEIDGVATTYGTTAVAGGAGNSTAGPACTGRVRLWSNTGTTEAKTVSSATNVAEGLTSTSSTTSPGAEASFNSASCLGAYGTDRDALVSISYQFDTMKLAN